MSLSAAFHTRLKNVRMHFHITALLSVIVLLRLELSNILIVFYRPTMVGMGASLTAPILTMEDLFKAISQIQKNHSKSIGAPEIPSVR